jgi:Cytochrome C and Quinol oxidase polypeptide I
MSEAAPSGAPARDAPRYHAGGAAHPDLLRIGRIPVSFFLVSVMFFAAGVSALPFIAANIADYFYQLYPLALVHTFTLGWITATIMGVMYRYVPALTRRPIRWPRMAYLQLALFAIGTSGMVAHFLIGVWLGLWLAAIFVVLSILMFAANIVPCLWRDLGRGVAETGMFLAIVFLILAATLGLLLGMDKTYDFLGGDVLTNISAHAHLAAAGWVTLSICAVSYRMIPAFVLPKVTLPPAATWQLYALAAGVAGLAASLLLGLGGVEWWAAIIALSLLAYVAIMVRLVRTRRMPLDWTPRHALAGIAWLLVAIVLGLALSVTGAQSEVGARIADAYGVIGLLGWISNFIMGMSYQLFAGFAARARGGRGWAPVTIAELSVARPRPFVFVVFNGGLALMAGGFLAGALAIIQIGAVAITAAGLVYAAATLWTLSYAFRRSLPPAARASSLRILPS